MIGALASRHIREETETKSVKGVRWQSFRTINLALPGLAGVLISEEYADDGIWKFDYEELESDRK